ncbi:Flocculation protein FLO11 [Fusarium oxysporum f. sp. albedinis]|nr:Flocculation protein FLO11 [Fusarium oxysporum f. sp. albedinis]
MQGSPRESSCQFVMVFREHRRTRCNDLFRSLRGRAAVHQALTASVRSPRIRDSTFDVSHRNRLGIH